ncbi:deaminase domain-containing protein [Streptomyces sp. NPDC054835]|uniref:deaminase domain-containing protein n=1 Tax=Streptomyces sp. NBC_01268 TaxID=2903806 RepID=UPI002E3008DA|nr:deaminase domain-containing protein [Streptomyces sp. NBC_01268]
MTTAAFTNKAILTYSIAFIGYPGLEGEFQSVSHQALRGDNYYKDIPEPADWTGALRERQHTKDAERQVVNLLADKIYNHLGCTSTADYKGRIGAVRKGTLDLYSDMGPCHSCRSVIKDFRKDFPALTLRVRYRNAVRGGGSAALIEAGGGLYGAYGIGDATQGSDGLWAKTYPGSPVAAATGTFDVKFAGGKAGKRYAGTATAIDRQPHSSYLYPAPKAGSVPLDEVTAVLDGIALDLSAQMVPEPLMRPQSFRQWIQGIERGTVRLDCERGPVKEGRIAVAAFIKDFPKVAVEVAYPGAAAQADDCGYTNAIAQGDGTWLKSFPASS